MGSIDRDWVIWVELVRPMPHCGRLGIIDSLGLWPSMRCILWGVRIKWRRSYLGPLI